MMEAGAPPASGLKFRTKQKAQARWSLGPKRYCPDNRNPPTDPMACLERARDSGFGNITAAPVSRRLTRAVFFDSVGFSASPDPRSRHERHYGRPVVEAARRASTPSGLLTHHSPP